MRSGTYLLQLPWGLDAVGGVNQVVFNLYRQFDAEAGLRPRVLVADWDAAEPIDAEHSSGTRFTRIRLRQPFITSGFLPFQLARYALAMPAELKRLRTLIRRHDVRVVNCHYIGQQALVWFIARKLGLFRGKIVLSLHGLDIRTISTLSRARRWLWKRALESADTVVACSRGLAEETVAAFALSGGNVVTIHNGVQAKRLEALAGAASARSAVSRPHLVNLGTFEHKKGHDLLLRAYARLAPRFPTAHLTIVGRPAGTLEATRALIAELQLHDRVTLTLNAPHEVALAVLGDADVFILPSRNEAFSVALLEAGAMGKPVVAASVCGVPELIDHRSTGLLVPPDDVDALTRSLEELLADPRAAERYGQALQGRVLQDFTAEVTFRKYLALAG